MPILKTHVVGPLVLPDGDRPQSAVLRFQLQTWDKSANETILMGPVDVACDVNADFDVELWASVDGVNSTTYSVSVTYFNDDMQAARTDSLGVIAVPTLGPVNLSDLLTGEVTPITTPDGLATMAAYLAGAEAAEAAAVAAAAVAVAQAEANSSIMFRRKLHLDLPMHPQAIIDFETAKGAPTPGLNPLIYPQYVCADDENDNIFIWYGGYCSVYDFFTGQHKTTFEVSGAINRESLTFRKSGATRYLYGMASYGVWRIDITTLPASGSVVTPTVENQFTVTPTILSRLNCIKAKSSADDIFTAQMHDTTNPVDLKTKARHVIFNADLEYIGEIEFPIGVVGSYETGYLNGLPKEQANCFHNGSMYFGIGGDYRLSATDPDTKSTTLMSKKQGIARCSMQGDVLGMALCHPDTALAKFETLTGRVLDVIENEGIFSAYGKVWALWQTTGPAEWDGTALNYGIVITEEMSSDPAAIDFSDGAVLGYNAINQRDGLSLDVSLTQLVCPVLGTPLTSFSAIFTMMGGLNLDYYEFWGNNQTITDINGDPVFVTDCIVSFKIAGKNCEITVSGENYQKRYWVTSLSTTPVQATSLRSTTDDGDNLIGYDEANVSTKNSGHIHHWYGRATHRTENTHALDLSRSGSNGFLAACYNTVRALIGGIYQYTDRTGFRFNENAEFSGGTGSPEGVVTSVIGSQWNRTDGDGSIYVKTTATGNTGWVAIENTITIARASMVSRIAAGFVPTVGKTYFLDGLAYIGSAGATQISDLNGLLPVGTSTPEHFGCVGDGVTDDGLKLQAMYTFARDVYIPEKTYVVNNRTIQVTHPTRTAGHGSIVFTGMGGFAGKDGFNVTVSLTAKLLSETSFDGIGILTSGAFGRSGIKTPTNELGGGDLLYRTVRPKFSFTNLRLGSLERTPSVSSNTIGVYGWKDTIQIGESADSVFENLEFIQPFVVGNAVATWGGREDCSAIYLNAGVRGDGAGPIYHPRISGLSGFGCGIGIKTKGFIAAPRISNVDLTLCGFGISSTGSFSGGGAGRDCIEELSFSDSNLNVGFGGIYMEATGWIDVSNVRTSVPVVDDIATDWVGLKIDAGFHQINADGFRTAQFSTTGATRNYVMMDVNARPVGDLTHVGQVAVTSPNILTNVARSQWNNPIKLRNVREASIEPPMVSGGAGTIGSMIYLESDHTTTTPRIYVSGTMPTAYDNVASFGVGGSINYIFTEEPSISGVSANDGYFVKESNGIMRAYRTINSFAAPNTASGALFSSAEVAFDFPAGCVFTSPPVITASARSSTNAVWVNARPSSTTAGVGRVISSVSLGTAVIVDVSIIGRWK